MATYRKRVAKRGVRWCAMVRIAGHDGKTKTFDRLNDAKRWAENEERIMRSTTSGDDMTVGEVIDHFLSVADGTRHPHEGMAMKLEQWKALLGEVKTCDLKPSHIVSAREILRKKTTRDKKPVSPATVNRYSAALATVFRIAHQKWDLFPSGNPMRSVSKLTEAHGRERWLSDAERARLLETCRLQSEDMYLLVVLALSTGARLGELVGLQWRYVDLERKQITFPSESVKNKSGRSVPLTLEACEALEQRKACVSGDNVFSAFPRHQWDKARKAAGLEDFRFHDLRHSAGSYLAMSGASARDIAEILGHKTMQMVKRYTHLTAESTRPAIERMATMFLRPASGSDKPDEV